MTDARISYLDIARANNVSGATIHLRMNKLENAGILSGTRLIVNPDKLGFKLCAFIAINLEKGGLYNDAVKVLRKIKEVTECCYVTGAYSMFVKLYCKDTAQLREILNEQIQKIQGVQKTETFIILEQSIERQVEL
jgi:Lrp/AsnC family transcriptional regulator for asnA, asnC and gidA